MLRINAPENLLLLFCRCFSFRRKICSRRVISQTDLPVEAFSLNYSPQFHKAFTTTAAAFRGYVRCDLNRERWRTTFRGVPSEPPNGSVLTDDAPAFDVATFVVEDGQPGAVQDGDIPTPDAYEGPSRRFDPDELD